MFQSPPLLSAPNGPDLTDLLEQLARCSTRPRYAFMVLNLIAQAARPNGSAGPWVSHAGNSELLRDWLCDALTPMGWRDPRRRTLAERVREELAAAHCLPVGADAAERAVENEVRLRVRASGKANLSRAVSELVRAGLLCRHYQGYRVDHENRGAQRHAVYTLAGLSGMLLAARQVSAAPATPAQRVSAIPAQLEFPLARS